MRQRRLWLSTGAALALALLLIWWWPELPADTSAAGELLSAMAQSLAAVLAIVFAVTVMVVEFSSRYSHRLSLLDPALILLVPFLIGVAEQLRPESVVRRLDAAARREARAHGGPGRPRSLVVLDNLVMSAGAQRDYETFSVAIEALARLRLDIAGDHAASGAGVSAPDDPEAVVERLEEVGHAFLSDPATARVLAEVFTELFSHDLRAGSPRLQTHPAIESLTRLATKASRDRNEASVLPLASALGELAQAASEGQDTAESKSARVVVIGAIVDALAEVGQSAIEARQEDALLRVVWALRVVGAREAERMDSRDSASSFAVEAAAALGLLGNEAAKQNVTSVVRSIAQGLGDIGRAAYQADRDWGIGLRACNALESMTLELIRQRIDLRATEAVIDQLGAVGEVGDGTATLGGLEAPGVASLALDRVLEAAVAEGNPKDWSRGLLHAVEMAVGAVGVAAAEFMSKSNFRSQSLERHAESCVALLTRCGQHDAEFRRDGQPIATEFLEAMGKAAAADGNARILRYVIAGLRAIANAAVAVPLPPRREFDYLLVDTVITLGNIALAALQAADEETADAAVEALRVVSIEMQRLEHLERMDYVVRTLNRVGDLKASDEVAGLQAKARKLAANLEPLLP
jgi:hypothetical protein